MKYFVALLCCLFAFNAYPQALWRNFFTTNQNPLVTVTAGSNATVQASTVGVNQRVFTVNAIPGAGTGQTNNVILVALTNVVVVTNVGVGQTTYSIGALTDTNVVNSLATNAASGAPIYSTNVLGIVTNAYNAVYSTNWTMVTNTAAADQVPVATSASSAAWVPGWTNAVFWNAAGTHHLTNNANGWGVDGAAAAGYELYVNGDFRATTSIESGAYIQGTHLYLTGLRIYSLNNGGFKITDNGAARERVVLNGLVKALTDASAVSLAQINVFTNSTIRSAFVGGVVDYTINCIDAEGGEAQTLSGIVTFSACNTNGVFYNAVATEVAANQAKSVTSGTLTTTWALTPKSGNESTNINLTVSADTSLTPAANKFYILWHMRSNGTNNVTAL